MQYSEMILKGLMYISSFVYSAALISVSVVFMKILGIFVKENDKCETCRECKTKPGQSRNAPQGKREPHEESDEERMLRIELENIDKFYTNEAQREVE